MSKTLTFSGAARRDWRRELQGLAYVAPFLLGFLALWLFPMLYSVGLTLHSWDLVRPPEYVGFTNFAHFVSDGKVLKSLGNTGYYTFLGVPLRVLIALMLALSLNVKIRGRTIYRTIFYIPSVTPAVAGAVIWTQIFHTEFGILNNFLGVFGVQPIKWLWDPRVAKPAFILMSFWGIGPQMVIFLAGLQGIPAVLYEAARIDGAGKWQSFLHVTLPMLSPVLFFNLVMGFIGSFQVFTASYIMTQGGPQDATLFFVLYVFRNGFQYFKMGYASLLAWFLCLIIALLTFIQFRFGSRWVYYEAI